MGSFPGPEALEALRSVTLLAFGLVFLAGLAMGIAPASYALYPVIAGYVAGDEEHSTGRGVAGPVRSRPDAIRSPGVGINRSQPCVH